ncbi:site-specific integrase [Pseudomonas abieticivorans]|uniref:site-specific integrase n=1 Tax=Pseudomonas abieticivorans TaxID=2931382 RepID=UPI0020BDD79D|nr:site-specific integrase [Pseudomonas sp. PIA16]
MKEKITAKLLKSLKPQEKSYRVHDTMQPGFSIRVLPSGHASYMVTWERNKAITLGRVGKMTLEQARTEALQHLAEAHAHGEPLAVTQGRRDNGVTTLRAFLDDEYYPWFRALHKSYDKTRLAIEHGFSDFMELRISDISIRDLESKRTNWLGSGLAKSTTNRKMACLRGVLSRAVEWGRIDTHPMDKFKQHKTDALGSLRFLSTSEEERLRSALDSRQEKIRAKRENYNAWRAERKKSLFPTLRESKFADHLLPMVLISLNTGIRQGELFNLCWSDIDLIGKTLTIKGGGAKSGQTRHIPLNSEAYETLVEWQKSQAIKSYVFPSQQGNRLDNVRKSWDGVKKGAAIENFRWHDLRHTFASNLAMLGEPMNTIRELLGHSDMKMTLRYAHLAPYNKARAVEKLSQGFGQRE